MASRYMLEENVFIKKILDAMERSRKKEKEQYAGSVSN